MRVRRIMIAAPKSGSGKTMITCALLQAFKDAGQSMVSYKCGPDYIDPMFHQKVIGIPSKNLDTFFTSEEDTKRLFLRNRKEGEFAILEGVMGLFDGLSGIREEGSSYHLAKITKTPIILVVDAKGMGRSVIPLLAGFLAYDKEKLIKGVILNRITPSYYETLKPFIEAELPVRVLGYFPEYRQFSIESRHLGLMLPDEIDNVKERLQKASEEIQKSVSLKLLTQIAELSEELSDESAEADRKKALYTGESRPIIAVARDEAFCFYYEDNLRLLEEKGAKLEFFSPLHDTALPDKCCGILLGGGYPELYAEELSQNADMLGAIKAAAESEMPIVAECGGFMYLHSVMETKEKKQYAMVGTVDAKCSDTGKSVRFGYIELEEKKSSFLPEGERIRGHEFHYFDSEDNGSGFVALKPVTGRSYPCMITGENKCLGFPHLYYPSNPAFAENFVKKAGKYKEGKGW
ncbi:MAG: cobyrinate a,c-diamide synthase [Bacteroidales bacterium]|nr:cobyrinate a,c-diamide synthase [Lachnoclostridium sp.]MCM1384240.1 cobyrinate a,c-diamide synthase [Lachnoclostridium sp.]MCM1464739.1 cobyrinate a,c-diamide synthase [Bacteroidales bacterium]